jgi:hypothetical protein
MSIFRKILICLLMTLLFTASGWALFRSADMVVIPVAAAIDGLNDSVWRSDLEILNVDTVAVDIAIIFLPSEGFNNASWYLSMENHLGGREDEGWGYVNPQLSDLEPGRSVVLEDVVRTYWGEGRKGAMILFAYEAGTFQTTEIPGGVPRLIKASSRTYTVEVVPPDDDNGNGGEGDGNGNGGDEVVLTYGQHIPGLPWYAYLSPAPNEVAKGLNRVVFTGIREDDRYRTALGLLNFSDMMTTVYVEIIVRAADGSELIRTPFDYPLEPLAHMQLDRFTKKWFDLPEDEDIVGATVEVRAAGYSSMANEPTPGLIAYVSRIDNQTNDPIHMEQSYMVELDWDCVFNGNCSAGTSALAAPWQTKRRPVSLGEAAGR